VWHYPGSAHQIATRYVLLIRSGVVKQLVQPLAVQREQLDNSGYPANRELSGPFTSKALSRWANLRKRNFRPNVFREPGPFPRTHHRD
jgi:hypothetical protein